MIRLSNSAIDTFKLCPRKFKLHYLDKIRSDVTYSPLVFGSAIDEALNGLLLSKKKVLTEEEKLIIEKDPYEVFSQQMQYAEINGETFDIRCSDKILYFNSDLDLSVLNDDDYAFLNKEFDLELTINSDNVDKFFEEYKQLRRSNKLTKNYLLAFNALCWKSLHAKGYLFIDAYKEEVIPQLDEVLEIQKEIRLNGNGDNYIIGYVDFIAVINGEKYIVDNKTASKAYTKDSVATSQQLSIYTEAEEHYKAAYCVMVKVLRKKKPRVRIQLILDTISDEQIEKVFDKIGEVEYNIEEGNFEPDFSQCKMQFGRPCVYNDYCNKNKCMNGLVKKEK